MKYCLLVAIAFFCAIDVSIGQAATCGEGEIVKLKASESLTIDGIGNEAAWARVTPSPILSLTVGQNQPGYAAQWRALWDNTYLYVFVEVTDPTIVSSNGPNNANYYNFDGVEIFVDGFNAQTATYNAADHQYGFSLGTTPAITVNPTGISEGPNNGTKGAIALTGINYGRVYTATGYNMEIQIPWTNLGGGVSPNPATGKNIGFDIAIDDDNNGSTRQAQYSWHASGFDEYQNASEFATVPLVDCPAPPLTLVALSSNLTCSGVDDGVIAGVATGGTAPYAFTLNNSGGITVASSSTNTINVSGLSADTYTLFVTDAASPMSIYDTSIVLTAFVNSLTVASDVHTICAGSPVKLTATGAATYAWTASPSGVTAGFQNVNDTALATLTVKPTVTTTYTVTTKLPANLILNPGFEAGNIGFTSDYRYIDPSQLPTTHTQEVYGIVYRSDSFNVSYTPTFFDHTTGNNTGHMLVADGAVQNDPTYGTSPIVPALAKVWSQTVTVQPNTNYVFSYYLHQGSTAGTQASVDAKINNIPLTIGSVNPVAGTAMWTQITYNWNSGVNTSATIALYDIATNDNNLAIDDLSLNETCSLSKDTTITVNKSDTAIISNDTTICSGNNATINFSGTPGTTVTYQKKDLKTSITSANATIVLDAITGMNSLSLNGLTDSTVYTLINVSGGTLNCPQNLSAADTIKVLPLPTATISGDTSICAGIASNITFTGTKGATVTYTINNGTNQTVVLDPVTGTKVISTGGVTVTTVYALVNIASAGTPSCPQTLTGTATVQIGNPPSAAISGDTALCNGSPATTITFTGTKGATVTYIINEGANQTIVLDAVTGINTISTGKLAATTVYKLVNVSLSPICVQSLSDSAVVTINPLPVADFMIPQASLCEQNTFYFDDASSAHVTNWTYSFGDGSPSSSLQSPPHIYANAGTYAVSLLVKDVNGCSGSLDTSIIVNALPQPGFTPPQICIGSSPSPVSFTATNSGTATNVTWQWDIDNVTPPLTGSTVSYSFTTGGAHTIKLVGTSGAGCVDSLSQQDTAYFIPTAADSIVNNMSLCSNVPVMLVNQSSVNGFGSISEIDIYWDYLNNPSKYIAYNNPQTNSEYVNQYPVLGTDATYEVRINVFSGNGCPTSPVTTLITVHGSPLVQFTALAPVCQETPAFTLSGGSEVSGPTTGLAGYSGPGVGTDSSTFTPQNAGPGTFPIVYTFTTVPYGCFDTAMQNISVYPTPLVDYGGTQSVLAGDSITLNPVSVSAAGLQYAWSPGTYLSNDTIAAPIVKPLSDQTYTITVTSPGGCSSTATLLVQVLKDFAVPNTFTPNHDGINDTWVIEELPKYPIQWVQVFDRYGQLLFESHGYSTPWDGTYKGTPVAAGTYYYIIELNGIISPKTGYVTVLR